MPQPAADEDAIPGLEILANDVADQLFYPRSRGLGEADAKRLVVEGFLAALVERFGSQALLREAVAGALERRLETVLT